MEYLQSFIAYLEKQPGVSKLTVKNYKADVLQFIIWTQSSFHKDFEPELVDETSVRTYLKQKNISAASLQRHTSSLRRFFSFLGSRGFSTAQIPTQSSSSAKPADIWHLKDFKDHLYISHAAGHTIKNYIIDVRQFLSWAQTVSGGTNVFDSISDAFIEEYKQRLLLDGHFSPKSINRKLSSIRKYLSWSFEKGYSQKIIVRSNIKPDSNVPLKALAQAMLGSGASKLGEIDTLRQNKLYSRFPPLRLAQKTRNGLHSLAHVFFILPTAMTARKIEYLIWFLRGRPIFDEISLPQDEETQRQKVSIENIAKSFYAPIKTSHFPFHKKVLHHLQHTRPKWYKEYQSYQISRYFNLVTFIIVAVALGLGVYKSFLLSPQTQNPALAAFNTNPRVLSFHGHLSSPNGDPITTPQQVRFAIYNDPYASSAATLLWQEADTVTPDIDGSFSILLGNSQAQCGAPLEVATTSCKLPSSIFAQNTGLYLGVSVGSDPELSPRQQLSTADFAQNAQMLSGMPAVTAANAGTSNVVLALDSSGNLTIGGSANPVFQATGGTLTLSGQALVLSTLPGSGGNVAISPDGIGQIDLQKPLVNTTSNSNNLPGLQGAVEVDDIMAILATSSAQSALTINQNDIGPLISASSSGIAKFSVDNSGNTAIAGNLNVGGTIGSDLTPSLIATYNLGSPINFWKKLFVDNITLPLVGV
ncbi:MAG TPA: site-specific integrase, partial [Candidatus Saccharimonadales bacterium]|nr:site-specific integrase [Candidatus Saccharimonadales bacterium]